MTPADWRALFDEAYPEPGLPAQYLAAGVLEEYLYDRLNDAEEREVRDRGTDPAGWVFPGPDARPLPPAYKAFLGWSNGGLFVAGDREFQVLKGQELREYLLLYDLPGRMPMAVPWALDGAGGFLLFDLRNPPDGQGEYRVLHTAGDRLSYPEATGLGASLAEAFRAGRSPA